MTTETENTQTAEEVQVKNPAALLAKNRELLQQLTETKAALQTAQDALGKAQSDKAAMSDRWYQLEVMKPLEADLRDASAMPWKYLQDTAAELGLLKMVPDAEGFERPQWFDEKSEPADLSGGLHKFLSGVYERTQNDLGRCLRASGTQGSGASGSTGRSTPAPTTTPTPTPTPMKFGIR